MLLLLDVLTPEPGLEGTVSLDTVIGSPSLVAGPALPGVAF